MKIIREGRHPSTFTYTGTCGTCGTEVECLRTECIMENDGRNNTEIRVPCPLCKKHGDKSSIFLREKPL
jgi:hypothetical protein